MNIDNGRKKGEHNTKRNASSKKEKMCCSCNVCNNKLIIPDNISTYICPFCHGSMNRNHWSSNNKCSCRSQPQLNNNKCNEQKTKLGEEDDVLKYTCLTCFNIFPDIVVDSTCSTWDKFDEFFDFKWGFWGEYIILLWLFYSTYLLVSSFVLHYREMYLFPQLNPRNSFWMAWIPKL